MGAAKDQGVDPGRRADSERGCGGGTGAVVRGAAALRRCGGKRPGAIPALGHGGQSRVGAKGGRAGGVRGLRLPERAPVQAPPVPGNFSPSATRSRLARRRSSVVFVLLPFLRRQRDGGGCGRGSGPRLQPRCAGGFLRTTSRSSRARVPRPPTTEEAAKLTFLESSHDQAGFPRPRAGAGAPVAAFPGERLCRCLGRSPAPVTGRLLECNAIPGLAHPRPGPGPGCGTGQSRTRQPCRTRDGENNFPNWFFPRR